MTQILAVLVLVALAIAGVQSWRLSRTSDDLAAAQAKVSAYAEAAQIRKQQDADLDRLRKDAATLDDDLSTAKGGDNALSPYFADAARKLWPD